VGAKNPEDYGDYFAWGETATKSNYDWSTLKYCEDDKGGKFSKYNTRTTYGSVDNKTTLERTDDAVTVNWGSDWCMPTQAQFQELKDKCTWTWTTKNGKNGYEVKGKNGKSIFLPAAGFRHMGGFGLVGSLGLYWTRELNDFYPNLGYRLRFGSVSVERDSYDRCDGISVRPVRCR